MARVVPPPKKRNPQDATLRNVRALKAKVRKLETDVRKLLKALDKATR